MTQPIANENSELFLVAAKPARNQNAESSPDLFDLYGDAMDQALGIEKASLSTIVRLNSCALDICQRVAGDLIGVAVNAFAFYAEVQLTWFRLMVPRVYEGSEVLLPVSAPNEMAANGGDNSTQRTAETPERGMDVALGAGSGAASAEVLLPAPAPGSAVASSPGGQAQPAEALELCMDVVIGAGQAA